MSFGEIVSGQILNERDTGPSASFSVTGGGVIAPFGAQVSNGNTLFLMTVTEGAGEMPGPTGVTVAVDGGADQDFTRDEALEHTTADATNIFRFSNTQAGDNVITITWGSSIGGYFAAIIMFEVEGVVSSSGIVTATNHETGSPMGSPFPIPATATVTAPGSPACIVSSMMCNGGVPNVSADADWDTTNVYVATSNVAAMAVLRQAAASAVDIDWVHDSISAQMVGCIAAYTEESAGPAGASPQLMLLGVGS
jgi:hypothetical protein